MINQVYVAGPWLMGSSTSNLPYIHPISSDPMQGVVRVLYGKVEVYNGGTWTYLPQNTAYLDMNSVTKDILEWAERKMHEEKQRDVLARMHPAISDALAAVHAAEEKLKVVIALTQENT